MRAEMVAERADAFKALAADQLPRLYSIARGFLGDDAEDAVQEALLKAFRKLHQLESEESGKGWLTTILINVCRDHARSRARRSEVVDVEDIEDFSLYRVIADVDPFPYSDSVHLDFLHEFGAEDVQAVLESIPDIYRVPLTLVHMQGFTTKEVARALDVPLGTILARLHRGRKLFEKRMWEYAVKNDLLKEGVGWNR